MTQPDTLRFSTIEPDEKSILSKVLKLSTAPVGERFLSLLDLSTVTGLYTTELIEFAKKHPDIVILEKSGGPIDTSTQSDTEIIINSHSIFVKPTQLIKRKALLDTTTTPLHPDLNLERRRNIPAQPNRQPGQDVLNDNIRKQLPQTLEIRQNENIFHKAAESARLLDAVTGPVDHVVEDALKKYRRIKKSTIKELFE